MYTVFRAEKKTVTPHKPVKRENAAAGSIFTAVTSENHFGAVCEKAFAVKHTVYLYDIGEIKRSRI